MKNKLLITTRIWVSFLSAGAILAALPIENNQTQSKYIATNSRYTDNDTIPVSVPAINGKKTKPIDSNAPLFYTKKGDFKTNKNAGRWEFTLDKEYEKVDIDTKIVATGAQYTRYVSVQFPFFPIPEYVKTATKDVFTFKGTTYKDETATICSTGTLEVLADEYDTAAGNDIYFTPEWKMRLDSTGKKLSIWIDNLDVMTDKNHQDTQSIYYKFGHIYSDPNGKESHPSRGPAYHHGDWGRHKDQTPAYNASKQFKGLTGHYYGKYSYANDKYDIKQTNKNLVSWNYENGQELSTNSKPYFTSKSTYLDIEEYIKDSNLIESRDNTPLESANFVFFDEWEKEIDKSSNLDTSFIHLKLVSKIEGEKEYNPSIIGNSPILDLTIPYFNIETYLDSFNMYEYNDENDVTDNVSKGAWYWENGKWVYKTNTAMGISFDGVNIESIKIGNKQHNLTDDERYTKTYKQFENNMSSSINKNIELTNSNGYSQVFGYEFKAEGVSNSDIDVNTLNPDGDELKVENTKMSFDMNDDGITQGNEIYTANVVNNNFSVVVGNSKGNEYNYIAYKWDGKNWSKHGVEQEQGHLFETQGIYGFSAIDEYGNNSFEIVEYDKNGGIKSGYSDNLEVWNSTNKQYITDKELALQQGMKGSEYDNKSAHEMRSIDNVEQGKSNLKNLDDAYIDNKYLEDVTNKYQSGSTEFGVIKPELEAVIEKQMEDEGYDKESYEIIWDTENNNLVMTDDLISYSLVPNGSWLSTGRYENEFNSLAKVYLDTITISNSELVAITNKYEQGKEFGDMRVKLEKEIASQLEPYGVMRETLDYEWNLKDDDKVYYDTKISYVVNSDDRTIAGSNDGDLKSDTYWNLKHVEINNAELQKIVLDYEGKEFGVYREDLENEINRQLIEQGYPADTWISINWDVVNTTIVEKDEVVSYQIVSLNKNHVKFISDQSFIFGVVNEPHMSLFIKFLIVIVSIITLLIFTFIGWQIYKHFKNKNDKNKSNQIKLEQMKNNKRIQKMLEEE